MKWLRAVAFASFAGPLAGGCILGNHAECNGGTRRCGSTKGVYQECSGGEGYFYWSDRNCPGLDPVCITDDSSSTHCEDRSNPQACPAGHLSLAGTLKNARPLRVADVDGDGSLDLLLAQSGGLEFAHGDGRGSFAEPTAIPISVAGVLADAHDADVDGDGHLDLVLSSYDPPEIYVLRGNGAGSFAFLRRFFVDQPFALTEAADLDGDGRDEVVAISSSSGSRLHVLSGLGNGKLSDETLTPLEGRSTSEVDSVIAAKFDPTGNLDLFARDADAMRVLEASGKSYRYAAAITSGSLVGDIDGDGLADVVSTNRSDYEAPRLYSYLSAGDGTFRAPVATAIPAGASLVATLDADGDHRLDVVAGYAENSLTVFRGIGDGTFADGVSFSTDGSSLSWVFHADFDGDGHEDLAVPSTDAGIVVLRGACTVP